MTVTMTIEEFDELREAKRTLDEVEKYLYKNVHYSEEADLCWPRKVSKFAKALPAFKVEMLIDLLNVPLNSDNIDQPEEETKQ